MGRPGRPTRGAAGARALENQIRRRYGQCVSLFGEARASLARPVLVVEDDPGVRDFLVSVLVDQGYRVIAAASGEEAAELLDGERAQLAVLDVGLPGMDGFAVAELLAFDVPVIIVTGDPVGAYARMQGRVEHFQVLPKPVAAELLEHAVAAAV